MLVALPNLLSLARLFCVPLIVWLILDGRADIAFIVFVLAGVTDAVDGFIAKRFGAVTELGKFLDPLADKALLVSVYVALASVGGMPRWLVILVVFRDVLIVGGSLLIHTMRQTVVMNPLKISKLNTLLQIVLAAVALLRDGYGVMPDGIDTILAVVVAVTTFLSGAAYVWVWGRSIPGLSGKL
ncbi:CDP-alcohol phosphatidyltransferase family protein [Devosia sp.]|uniref:CDP-alcohol phosphatidyltransferase family protein n=1 Tax=Devosia sp. TaxID=1871048 RepID=UPI0019D997CD|nr:CDP-alcohol phosphatidyltransferase family protein [Devosia sp.]MBE0578463.1 CDP-alcohol phosphatidyltransferase family protein [Devosia sp.]